MRDLSWRLRVWAWRLGLPFVIAFLVLLPSALLLTGCAHRQRIRYAETTAGRCEARIDHAPTAEEARAIAEECHRRLHTAEGSR